MKQSIYWKYIAFCSAAIFDNISCTWFIHKFYGNLSISVIHKTHYGGLRTADGLFIGSIGFALTDSKEQAKVQL